MDSADSLPPLTVFSALQPGLPPEAGQNDEASARPGESFTEAQLASVSGVAARPARSIDPLAILHAAGERIRWCVLRELSKGKPLAVRQLAEAVGTYPDLLSKHLVVLRACGAVVELPGKDARHRFQTIPQEFAPRIEGTERVLDYGSCVLRFPRE